MNCSLPNHFFFLILLVSRGSVCLPLSSDWRLPTLPTSFAADYTASSMSQLRKGAALHVMHMITLAGLSNFFRPQRPCHAATHCS